MPPDSFVPRPKQAEVLAYTGGKMGVSAVPGSGKTETLSRLAAQLIAGGGLDGHQEVLVVTLVNSAVDNFYRRVSNLVKTRGLLPHAGYRVRTLHGLSHDIVRERPALVGLSDKFEIVDERSADEILSDAAAAWLRSHPYALEHFLDPALEASKLDWVRRDPLLGQVKEIALAFTRMAKDRQLTPEKLRGQLDELINPFPLAEMGWAIYTDYQRALAYRGAVDFDDLIRLALLAVQSDEKLLARLRDRWPFILEDEAQDSSRLQEQILRLLTGPDGNWVRVGDPNQAIYETFTTASPDYLRDFLEQEGVARRELPNSGRSTESIICLANYLVTWSRAEHPVRAVRDALSPPPILPVPAGDTQPNPPDDPASIYLMGNKFTPDGEVRAVVESLARWLPEHPDSTVAVLTPRNQRGFDVVDALRQRGLEVVDSLLRSSTSTRKAAGALANVLHHLADPTASQRLARVFQVWRRVDKEDTEAWQYVMTLSKLLASCRQVEEFVWPRAGQDWLDTIELSDEDLELLTLFRGFVQRWQSAIVLPIDQLLLTLGQDLFSEASDLAITHKLAVTLRQTSEQHPQWRLPELAGELAVIARNERRFLGFSEEDSGFDPRAHAGKVVVATMHKAKGLEWDRVYLMSVNSYDFPSGQPYDQYIAEKWFIRDELNLGAEALAQLDAVLDDEVVYRQGDATAQARLDYVRERLRLLYVGITRAKSELVVTWNSGRSAASRPEAVQALPFVALQTHWELGGCRQDEPLVASQPPSTRSV
ncbi:MAG: ATP-dependent helicase [Anaerolineae bacterium]|nr:ATP-dependent helicase [Anaerolineae bacterium]MCO5245124.1 ATP-dependent helicase [Anaerolineae bacterium]